MTGVTRKRTGVAASPNTRTSKRKPRSSNQDKVLPAVLQEMLDEANEEEFASEHDDRRPLKKRKMAQSKTIADSTLHVRPLHDFPNQTAECPPSTSIHNTNRPTQPHTQGLYNARNEADVEITSPNISRIVQTIMNSDESEDSDVEWEDALGEESDDDLDEVHISPEVGDISIQIGGKSSKAKEATKKAQRRTITTVEKKRRLDIHKMHVLCLLYHIHRRNVWCNDRKVQSTLRKVLSPNILENLVPNPTLTQFSASKRFVDSLNELKAMWSKRFKITAHGMSKPRWLEPDANIQPFSDFDELDAPMDKDEFRTAAHTLQGSQDIGTQLFCALLRGVGIEARLVCSLQPLPFASSAEKATPRKTSPQQDIIVLDPFKKLSETHPPKSRLNPRFHNKKLSRLERIMGERHTVLNRTGVAPRKQKVYHTPYPVYWIEAFDSAHQKWVPVDTHSTFTVNAPDKLEPPLSYAQNTLTYAIAFDEDYTAKDITRRYARFYNAKTTKFRVESTPNGEEWMSRTLKFFKRARPLDRDQLEDATLSRKEAAEGIPKNVQDFKRHPTYVLERHLKRNEVIYPLTQVGKVNCGSAMNPKMESIYRRNNVHVVRSEDKWYRLGRDVKPGEQPLKHAKPKRRQQLQGEIDPTMAYEEQAEEIGAALFAEFQTELYGPPPVVQGRVPRNVYGNLDLYVPSMCPAGGTHIRHKLAAKAAKIIDIDSADAVTGFSFKGRHGTAIVQGVVVATKYAAAVEAVIEGMEHQQEEAVAEARSVECLKLWRRFFLGLRIAQRVNAIKIDGETGPALDIQDEISKDDRTMVAEEMAGGFFPDEDDSHAPGTSRQEIQTVYEHDSSINDGGGFIPDDNKDGAPCAGESIPENTGFSGPAVLNRRHIFESSILDSQQLLPKRKKSLSLECSSDDAMDLEPSLEEINIAIEEQEATEAMERSQVGESSAAKGVKGLTLEQRLVEDEVAKVADKGVMMERVPKELLVGSNNHGEDEAEKDDELEQSATPSDTGSLPLEDPDDEDADPEWLIDVT